MVLLTELPPEIIHNVLRFVHPHDLAWVPQICRALYHSVTGNATLFKHVYLAHFDTPPSGDIDWEQNLKNLVHLQVICRRPGVDSKKHELNFVYDTVTELLKNASSDGPRATSNATHPLSLNAKLLSGLFEDHENQHAFLARSFLYERARGYELAPSAPFSSPPKQEHQKSSKLHCLYGKPLLYASRSPHVTRSGKMSPFACSKVYDLRQYTEKTKWGPFMDDDTDRVDWEKVEAIMIVLGANLKLVGINTFPIYKNYWDVPFAGVWPNSYKARPVEKPDEDPDPLDLQDPYGVSGTWLRVVCFLDYSDFFAFNFSPDHDLPANVPRRAIDVGEATRLILMRIRVTSIEPPGPDDGQALPVVHFKGVSRGLDHDYDTNANSDIRGIVRLTREGEVRWTTWSVFNGQERWRSESVQIGGVNSAKGVLGNWFDKDFDPRGPAGPTAFWKIRDRSEHGPYGDRIVLHDFLPDTLDGDDVEEEYLGEEGEFDELEADEEDEMDQDDEEDEEEEEEEEDDDDFHNLVLGLLSGASVIIEEVPPSP